MSQINPMPHSSRYNVRDLESMARGLLLRNERLCSVEVEITDGLTRIIATIRHKKSGFACERMVAL